MNIRSNRAEIARLQAKVKTLTQQGKEKDRVNEDQEREITSLRSQLSQLRKQRGLSHE
jgi:peptidoglycan hydrolase CwlO-like protein